MFSIYLMINIFENAYTNFSRIKKKLKLYSKYQEAYDKGKFSCAHVSNRKAVFVLPQEYTSSCQEVKEISRI